MHSRKVIVSVTVVAALLGLGGLSHFPATEEKAVANWKTFDEAARLAQKEQKEILIDVYTDWCSWCKKMDADVYANADVVKVLESRFIAVKLNAESSKRIHFNGAQVSEAEFARAAGVTGYPTTIFLDPSSRPITSVPGYIPAEKFRTILEYIGGDHYKSITFRQYLDRVGAKK